MEFCFPNHKLILFCFMCFRKKSNNCIVSLLRCMILISIFQERGSLILISIWTLWNISKSNQKTVYSLMTGSLYSFFFNYWKAIFLFIFSIYNSIMVGLQENVKPGLSSRFDKFTLIFFNCWYYIGYAFLSRMENVEAARAVGIVGVQFKNADSLRQDLSQIGVDASE